MIGVDGFDLLVRILMFLLVITCVAKDMSSALWDQPLEAHPTWQLERLTQKKCLVKTSAC